MLGMRPTYKYRFHAGSILGFPFFAPIQHLRVCPLQHNSQPKEPPSSNITMHPPTLSSQPSSSSRPHPQRKPSAATKSMSLLSLHVPPFTTVILTLISFSPYTNCVSTAVSTALPCEATSDRALATSCKCSTLSKVFSCYTSLCPPDNLNDVFTSQFNSMGCPDAPALKTATSAKTTGLGSRGVGTTTATAYQGGSATRQAL